MARCVCLGPQRPTPNVGDAVRALTAEGEPVAVISAGWQEAEGDIEPLHEIVQRPLFDLQLYARAEEVMAQSAPLRDAHEHRQGRLRELQKLYGLRLRHLKRAARDVLGADADPELLKLEQRHAISQLRTLDRHHLSRLRAIHDDYAAAEAALEAAPLAAHGETLAGRLREVRTVIVTGGSVPVIVNRMRLFGMGRLLADKQIVAWSAGAMALTAQVVLFHENAPQGRRDAEIFDFGLGLVPNVVLLPDARRRLHTERQRSMALFSRRFAPSRCLTLDGGARVEFEDGRVVAARAARQIARSGRLNRVRVS